VLINGRSNKRGHFFKSQLEVTAKPSSQRSTATTTAPSRARRRLSRGPAPAHLCLHAPDLRQPRGLLLHSLHLAADALLPLLIAHDTKITTHHASIVKQPRTCLRRLAAAISFFFMVS
jgi:hypothetical protein